MNCKATYVSKSPSWPGLDGITNLVVFGDSSTKSHDSTTWLGHFLRIVNDERSPDNSSRLIASNYAYPGASVEDDMPDQMEAFCRQSQQPAGQQFDPRATLYVFWLGINDCSRTDVENLDEIVQSLFEDGVDQVYAKAGAQNFLFIDVPPQDRSPGGEYSSIHQSANIAERYEKWNEDLKAYAKDFAEESPQATVFLFSSHAVVTEILDDPDDFDFQEDDVDREGGAIWIDQLHLSSEVHSILAERLKKALCTQ
ncbi:hypothetical protein BD410DRAFT_901086 [Rickenella mellea]|uniref:Carbohydrate esterase family 16 protein n=1 Tax=Rickenella mellea TaxID=50990 RepID=A0A4Y7PRG5_9AGAM|nr:hypothetical protein BD410DRAFT_901086 [Rickenella mellea]